MVYQNSRKSTVTTKQLEAQGAEETKHELKASMWGKPVTEDSVHQWSDKNMKKENYEATFCLYLYYWYTTTESWRRNSITTGAFLALTSELNFISRYISKQSDFSVRPPFFLLLPFVSMSYPQLFLFSLFRFSKTELISLVSINHPNLNFPS